MGLIAHKGILYGGGIDAISEASDVALTTPSDGDVIEYDGTEEKWVNGQLATVAKTGAYSDLSGTPTIPTVNNGQLTIQKNGSNVATFTANQSGNATANIVVPTKTSDITNDSGYITEADTEVESLPNTTPYLYRKSPAIGIRVMENALVGASVVVNQLVQNVNTWSASNATGSVSDNVLTFTATATRGRYYSQKDLPTAVDHVVLLCAQIKTTTATSQVQLYSYGGYAAKFCEATTNWQSVYKLTKTNSAWGTDLTNNNQLSVQDYRTGSWDAIQVKNPQVIDLTEYFGSSTIPDTAYTKETAQAGSGIAWLKSQGFDFSKYIAYNTGTIESVEVTGKEVVGFNQWDEEWEVGYLIEDGSVNPAATTRRTTSYIPVQAGETYYQKGPSSIYYGRVAYYDENKNLMAYSSSGVGETFTVQINAKYVRITFNASYGTTYNHDICINFSKTEGTPKNGDYVPYEKHTYSYPETTLRGLFELVNDSIVANGDRLGSDGTHEVVRGSIDLGDLSWTYSTALGDKPVFTTNISSAKSFVNGDKILCVYPQAATSSSSNSSAISAMSDKQCQIKYSSTQIFIADSTYTDAATFKTTMNGVYLEYPLATPTTEQLAPFDNPQISIVGGTEEFITNTDVPVGHESEYKALPALFEDDYIQYLQTKVEKGNPWKKQYRISNGYAIPNYNEIERLYTDMVLILQNGSNYVGSAFYPAIYGVPLYVGGTYSASGWVANDGTVSLTNASYMHVYLR